MDPPSGDGHYRPVPDLVAAAGVCALEDVRSKTPGTQASVCFNPKSPSARNGAILVDILAISLMRLYLNSSVMKTAGAVPMLVIACVVPFGIQRASPAFICNSDGL